MWISCSWGADGASPFLSGYAFLFLLGFRGSGTPVPNYRHEPPTSSMTEQLFRYENSEVRISYYLRGFTRGVNV